MGGPNLCHTQGADCQGKAETSSEDSSPKKTRGGLKRNMSQARRHQQGPSQRDAGLDGQQQEAGLPPTHSPDPISRKADPKYHPSILHTSCLPKIYHLQQTTAFCSLLPSRVTIPARSQHQGRSQQLRISPILGQNEAFLCLLSARAVKEGDLKACGTCAQQRGCGRVCRRTELLIKTARSDAIERLVVTLC